MTRTLLSFALTLLVAFTGTANPIDGVKKAVNAGESTIMWKGYKVTGSHTGNINLKSGNLIFDGDKLTGGEFVVDMATLISTDLSGGGKQKLEGHLHSGDFFATKANPTSTMVFTNVKSSGKNSYEVTGDLTIKGITKPVTFDISVYGSKAVATLKIDRTNYDMKFGSGSFFENLGDKTVYDDFELVVDLVM